MISNSVTHLRSYTNSAVADITKNSAPILPVTPRNCRLCRADVSASSTDIVTSNKVKSKVFYGQEPPSGESTTTECGVNYQLLAVITEVAQWGTPSCRLTVDHNQLRTMASETVDPIDWLHPPPTWAVPPVHLVHSINRCSSATAGIERATLQPSACEATTLPMRPLRV